MKTQVIKWTIEIVNLETKLRVGIWDHEREFQPILINISIRAFASAYPESIEDCLDYQPICRWMTDEWPNQSHTPLIETKLHELMSYIFLFDSRVEWVDAAISKPKAIPEARAVGVRLSMSRDLFESTFKYSDVSIGSSKIENEFLHA